MKTGLTLTELAQTIEAQNEAKRDFVVPTQHLQMVAPNGNPLHLAMPDGGMFAPTTHAHRQIGDRVGIPAKYYDRMRESAPDLLVGNVNHWLQAKPEKRLLRTYDTPDPVGTARAFLSDRYRPLDNEQLAEAALPILADKDMVVMSADITERRMYVKAIDPSMEGQIAYGSGRHNFQTDDVVHWGVAISNSEVGAGSLKVESFLFRQWCDNGMIVEQALARHHLGRVLGNGNDQGREWFRDDTLIADDRAFFMKLGDVVRGVLNDTTFHATLDKLSGATERKIEGKLEKVVEVTAKKVGLTEGESSSVLRHLIEGGDLSAWGMANAITRTAEDADSYDRATQLEGAGYKVIELAPAQWQEVATAA